MIVKILSDDLPGKQGDYNNTYVGMMLQNMENMLIQLGGNKDALKGISPENTFISSK